MLPTTQGLTLNMTLSHDWQVGNGCWLEVELQLWAGNHGSSPWAACASSQHDSWVPRASVPRESGKSTLDFYDLASEVIEHHFLYILLVEAVTGSLRLKDKGHRLYL